MSKSSTFSGEAASASDSVSWQQEMPSGATLHGVKEENSSQPPAVGAEHTGAPVSGFSDSEAALKDASYGVKRDASSEVDWLGALQYSVEHAASLRRGELWLLPDEAERLLSVSNAYLAKYYKVAAGETVVLDSIFSHKT